MNDTKNKNSCALVSIIIPVHNRDKASKCIEYLKRQTYPNIEIITVTRRGFPAEKRNYGYHKSHGEYVFFLDEDEYLSPNAIEEGVKVFEKGYDVVAIPQIKKVPTSYMAKCIAITRVNTPKMLFFRREVLEKVGLFNPEYILCDDVELYKRVLEAKYRFGQATSCNMLHDEDVGIRYAIFKTLFGRKTFPKIAYVCQLPTLTQITGVWTTTINRKRIFKQLIKEPMYLPGVLFIMGVRFLVRRIP